ncbi:hypothetical protein BMF94_4730 [Rhodotorula taiwanensis]|uniref:Uncharacterized protein n=1 Tax=Rhodotorula taiwanensis TaxID=741276 RepID=A0A2S5B613_9BASI|nr:hypothetical protein BMF94_4730 [Rhodotorula taiwanensis]
MTSRHSTPFPPDFEPVGIVGELAASFPAVPPRQPVDHRPPRGLPSLEQGSSAAIGPKAGARLLASQMAQRAMRKADNFAQFDDAEERAGEVDIRERVAVRTDGGLSTETGDTFLLDAIMRAPFAEQVTAKVSPVPSSTSSGQHSIPRVPVPRLSTSEVEIHSPVPLPPTTRRMSIYELTRQASEEEKVESPAEADKRKESLSRASGAGLGSPFAAITRAQPAESTTAEMLPTEPLRKQPSRRPPIAGFNRTTPASPEDPNSSTKRIVSHGSGRVRKLSSDSTGSVSKDLVLNQLSEAIKRERKKGEAYAREREQGEQELREIDRNLAVLREKYATILIQQEATIEGLQAELHDVETELDWANDLDEEVSRDLCLQESRGNRSLTGYIQSADRYLQLLSDSTAADSLRVRRHVVSSFDPTALGADNPEPVREPPVPTAAQPSVAVRKAAALFKRGLSLKRRVDTHVAAYDSVENIKLPKPSLPREYRRPTSPRQGLTTSSSTSATGDVPPPIRRPRKLSRSRASPAPVAPAMVEPAQYLAPELETPTHPASAAGPGKVPPPAPAPVFRSLSSAEPSPLDAKARPATTASPTRPKARRPPPVSGLTRSRPAEAPTSSDGEKGTNRSADVRVQPHRRTSLVRKRSNSFKQGVQSTMRILFPPHAPKLSKEEQRINNVREWMHADPPQHS